MNGGHQALNNAKLVIDDLQQNNKREILGSRCSYRTAKHHDGKHLSKRSKAVRSAASIGDNVNVRLVFLLIDTNNKHGGVLAGSRNDNLLSTTLQN